MFKKRICAQLNIIIEKMKAGLSSQLGEHQITRDMINRQYTVNQKELEKMSTIITSQQRTIEQLTNVLKDKYEHGLFVYSEDGQVIKAIQDGEEISLNRMSYLSVVWSASEAVSVTVERR